MLNKEEKIYWMQKAIKLINESNINKSSIEKRNIPVGAIILDENKNILSTATNQMLETNPIQHAEIVAINNAYKKINDLSKTTMFVTLEPCVMCAGAISHAKISSLIFGAYNKEFGGVCSKFDVLRGQNGTKTASSSKIEICGGVLEKENKMILDAFFTQLRKAKKRN